MDATQFRTRIYGTAVAIVAVCISEDTTFNGIACVFTAWVTVVALLGPVTSAFGRVASVDGTFVAVVVALEWGIRPTIVSERANGRAGVEGTRIVIRTWIDV